MSYRRSAAYTRGQVQELLELFPEASHLAIRQQDDGIEFDMDTDSMFLEVMSFLAQTIGDSQSVLQEFFRRREIKREEDEKAADRAARQSAGVRFRDDATRNFTDMEARALERAGIRGESIPRDTTPVDQVRALLRGLLASTGAGSFSIDDGGGEGRANSLYHHSKRSSRYHQSRERSRSRPSSPSRRESRLPSASKRPTKATIARQLAEEIQNDVSSPVVMPDSTTPLNPPSLSVSRNTRTPSDPPQQQRFMYRSPRVTYDVVGTVAQQATCQDPADLHPNDDGFYSLKSEARVSSSGMPPRTYQEQSLASSLSARPRYQSQQYHQQQYQQQHLRQTRPIRMDAPGPNEHRDFPPQSSNGSVGRRSVSTSSSSSVYVVEDVAAHKPTATTYPLPTLPPKQMPNNYASIESAAAIVKNEMLVQSRGKPLMDDSTASYSTPPTHVSQGNSNLSLQYHRSSTSDGTPRSIEERASNNSGVFRQRESFGNSGLGLYPHQSSSSPSTNERISLTSQSPQTRLTASSGNSSLGLQQHSSSPMTSSQSHHSRRNTDSPTEEKLKRKSKSPGDSNSQKSHRTRSTEPGSFDSSTTSNSQPKSLDSPPVANLKPRLASIGENNLALHNHFSSPAPSGSQGLIGDPRIDPSYSSNAGVTLQLESVGNSTLSLQKHYSSPAASNSHCSSRSESKLAGAVNDTGQSMVEKAQAAFLTNRQKSFESTSSSSTSPVSATNSDEEKSENSQGSFETLIHSIQKSANRLTNNEPKKVTHHDPPALAEYITFARDPDAERGEPKVGFKHMEMELNSARIQVHGPASSSPEPILREVSSDYSDSTAPEQREPPENGNFRSRREPGGRKFVKRKPGSKSSNPQREPEHCTGDDTRVNTRGHESRGNMRASVPGLSRPESSFNTSAAVVLEGGDSAGLKPRVQIDRDNFRSNQERSGRNERNRAHHPVIDDADDLQMLRRDSFDETASRDLRLHRRNPSLGDETASRKELLLNTKQTERTGTNLDVVYSEEYQQDQHHAIGESSSSLSSLSDTFAVKQKKQRSHPGTRKEKKKYYKSRGNPAFKTYASIRHHGSKSVGSYSTWETTDKESLVPTISRKDKVRGTSTSSRVKSGSKTIPNHIALDSSSSESTSPSASLVMQQSLISPSSRVRSGPDFVEVYVVSSSSSDPPASLKSQSSRVRSGPGFVEVYVASSSSSDSSASTAIEDIIDRCQTKLQKVHRRKDKPQKYW